MKGNRLMRTYGRRRANVYVAERDALWNSPQHRRHLFDCSPRTDDVATERSDGRQRKAKKNALRKLKACFDLTPCKKLKRTTGEKIETRRQLADRTEENNNYNINKLAAKDTTNLKHPEEDGNQAKRSILTVTCPQNENNSGQWCPSLRLSQQLETSMTLPETEAIDIHQFSDVLSETKGSEMSLDMKPSDGKNAPCDLKNAFHYLDLSRAVTVTKSPQEGSLSTLAFSPNAKSSIRPFITVSEKLNMLASTPKPNRTPMSATSGLISSVDNVCVSPANGANKPKRLPRCEVALKDLVHCYDTVGDLQYNRVGICSEYSDKLRRRVHLKSSSAQTCTGVLEISPSVALDRMISKGDGVTSDLSAIERTLRSKEGRTSKSNSKDHVNDGSVLLPAQHYTSKIKTPENQHNLPFQCNSGQPCIGQMHNLTYSLGRYDPSSSLQCKWSRMTSLIGRRKSVIFTPEYSILRCSVRKSELGPAISQPSPESTSANATPNVAQELELTDLDDNSSACRTSMLSLLLYDDSNEQMSGLAKDMIYSECKQLGPIDFSQFLQSLKGDSCVKIGEGVYGEVFRICFDHEKVSVLKVVPIEGKLLVNAEPQKSFEEIGSEVMISKALSSLRDGEDNQTENFIKLNCLRCTQGCYPNLLLQAWDKFQEKKTSDNDRPDFLEDSQLFVVFNFEDGGTSLEACQLSSMRQACSVLHQVVVALAVAEEALCFEHRDLHWGNVLVKKTNKKKLSYRLFGKTFSMHTYGVQAYIIDYTLSRMEHDGTIRFTDLASDELLFQGQGDYQFDIYRMMRNENNNNWETYTPHTNVLWLHYLTDKMMHGVKYRATRSQSPHSNRLLLFSQEALKFPSATELLTSGPSLFNSDQKAARHHT